VQQPAADNLDVVSTTLTRRLDTAISTDTNLCSLKLSQLAPDTRQDIIEGVETLDENVASLKQRRNRIL